MIFKNFSTIIFCFFCFNGFTQFTDNGSTLETSDKVIVKGNSSTSIEIDGTGKRGGFVVRADGGGTNTDDYFLFQMRNDLGDVVQSVRDNSASKWIEMMKFDYLTDNMKFSNNHFSNVQSLAIGFNNDDPSTEKLDINGKMRCLEAQVIVSFADYVFAEDYKMPTLEEEKSFIKSNKHLIGFQSEKDMGGLVELGDVTVRQQAKIEEIMLHLISLNENVKTLKEENLILKEKLKSLEEK